MKLDDLVTLTKNGFSRDDIMKLCGEDVHSGTSLSLDPAPETPAPVDPAPETPADPVPAAPQDDRIKQLETKLDYVINRFNYMAVQNSRQPAQPEETVDDILSSVIRGGAIKNKGE